MILDTKKNNNKNTDAMNNVEMVEIHPDDDDSEKSQPKKQSFIDRIKKVFSHKYEEELKKY